MIILFMTFFMILVVSGCTSDKDTALFIEQKLQEKYNEAFVVERVGGSNGFPNPNTTVVSAYPKKNPEQKFVAEVMNDFSKMWDDYMNIYMGYQAKDILNQKIDQYIPNMYWIQESKFDSGGFVYPESKFNKTNTEINNYEYFSYIVRVVIKNGDLLKNKNELIQNIENDLLNLGIKNFSLTIIFSKNEDLIAIKKEINNYANFRDYFNQSKDIELHYYTKFKNGTQEKKDQYVNPNQ